MNETDPPAGFFRLPAAVRRVLGSARQAGKTQLALDAVRAAADAGDWPAALARIQAETEAGTLSPQPVAAVLGRPVPAGVAVSGDAVRELHGLDRVSGVQGPPGQADGTTGPMPSDGPGASMTFGNRPDRTVRVLPFPAGVAVPPAVTALCLVSLYPRTDGPGWVTRPGGPPEGFTAVGGAARAEANGAVRVLLAGARLTLSGPRYLTLAAVVPGLPPAGVFGLTPYAGGIAWQHPADWAWTPDPTAAALVEAALGGDPAAFAAAFDRAHEEARPTEEIVNG